MTMTSEVKLEPTAEEIELARVIYCALEGEHIKPESNKAHLDAIFGPGSDISMEAELRAARAAILAMDRRASPAAEPDAWQHRIRVSRMDGGKQQVPFEWTDWTEWREGKFGSPGLAGDDGLQFEERALYASPPAPAVAVPEAFVAAATHALDVADRLIERGYGTDKPEEWDDVYRAVAEARIAAAPQPPATRSYEEGKRAAKVQNLLALHLKIEDGEIMGTGPASYAIIRSLADEPRHGE